MAKPLRTRKLNVTETRAKDVCAERRAHHPKSVTNRRRQVRFNYMYIIDTLRRQEEHHGAWTRCHNVLRRAEDVCAEDVSITQKVSQIEDVQLRIEITNLRLYRVMKHISLIKLSNVFHQMKNEKTLA